MHKFISNLISKVKGEEFKLDPEISLWYLVNFFINRFVGLVNGVVVFRKFQKVFISPKAVVKCTKKIKVGSNLAIHSGCYIDALSRDGIVFGDNVSIQKNVAIECTGTLKNIGKGVVLGNNVGIGSMSFLGAAGGICIGDDTIMGNYVSFHSENHNFEDPNKVIRLQGINRKGITIGKNCWIGAKVTILDGTQVGDGCIIAAGAVLTGKKFENNSIIAGVPARVIGHR